MSTDVRYRNCLMDGAMTGIRAPEKGHENGHKTADFALLQVLEKTAKKAEMRLFSG